MLEPSHGWTLLLGMALGFVIATVGYTAPTPSPTPTPVRRWSTADFRESGAQGTGQPTKQGLLRVLNG